MAKISNFSDIEKVRLEKIEALRGRGINPFPAKAQRTHTSAEALAAFEAQESKGDKAKAVVATLVGRLRSMRVMGKIIFAHIEDGWGSIQLFLRADDVGQVQLELFRDYYDLGDFVQATGEMFRTRTGEPSLKVADFTMLAKAVTPLPAAKDEEVEGEIVRHAALTDPETRYRQRYADLAVNPEVREVFRIRAAINRALRSFLDNQGFLEVETPVLHQIYGGAAARPFITHHNQLKQDLFLRISFELYLKRLLVGNLERVYEIGRDFRNEGVDRTHNPEFTMLEFYMAYANYEQVMQLTEEMLAFTAKEVLGGTKFTYQRNEIELGVSWPRIELKDGVAEFADINLDDHPDAASLAKAMRAKGLDVNPTASRGKLIDDLLGALVEPRFIQPTFIYNYPREISPLAKSLPHDPVIVERFEGHIAGMEICNAFSELNDPLDQEARFQELGRGSASDDENAHPMDEDYLRAMRYGMPPNGGFGMGIDRLTMLFTDRATIREVILFPHLRQRED
ncbi:MAG: lysine--tRNA ligase [Chloroflexi bacterium]|nr:lysine--tRNA ligase [Chloroflexota bacterium]MQC26836.1 lysine--tRNA ligase [Chloroflexota bacterium]